VVRLFASPPIDVSLDLIDPEFNINSWVKRVDKRNRKRKLDEDEFTDLSETEFMEETEFLIYEVK